MITAVDGQAVAEFEDLADAIEAKAVGDTVTLSVIKNGVENPDGDSEDISVTLEARPDAPDIESHFGESIDTAFDSFVDGTFRYVDEDGNTVTVEVFAGTITSLSEDEITIDVNGNEGEKTVSIPDDVEVPDALETGDRAAVVIKDGAVEAILTGGFPLPLPGIAPDSIPMPDGGFDLPFGGEGDAFTVEVVAGTVSSVSAGEITLELGGDQDEKTFSIPDGVEVPEGLEAGDDVTVVLENGEVAKIVEGGLPFDGEFELPFDGEVPFPQPFRGGPSSPFDQDDGAPEA